MQVRGRCNLPQQFPLGPAKPTNGLKIPQIFLSRKSGLQYNHILCPTDLHRRCHRIRFVLVSKIKRPHPAQVPGREPGGIRICALQILRGMDGNTFLRPAADQPANLAVQFQLRQSLRQQYFQFCEQGAIINGLPDIHGFSSFPAYCA